MADYFKLYFNADDTEVQQEGETTGNKISFTLNIDDLETGEVELYAQAETGYKINDLDIDFSGTTADRWSIKKEPEDTYDSTINFNEVSDSEKSTFWVQAEATAEDTVEIDETVTIDAEGTAEATE